MNYTGWSVIDDTTGDDSCIINALMPSELATIGPCSVCIIYSVLRKPHPRETLRGILVHCNKVLLYCQGREGKAARENCRERETLEVFRLTESQQFIRRKTKR